VTAFDDLAVKVLAGNQGNSVSQATFLRDPDDGFVYRWPLAEATPAELAEAGSKIAAAARRQKADAVKSGAASGATQLPAGELPPVPPPSDLAVSLRQAVDGALGDLAWAKTALGQVFEFAAFAGANWRWVALAVAGWYGLRFLYDSHLISVWRARDHNEGRNVLPALQATSSSSEAVGQRAVEASP
jgi:hypothetical protein